MSTGFAIFLALCAAYAIVGVALVLGTATRVRVQRVLPKNAARKPKTTSAPAPRAKAPAASAPPQVAETTRNPAPAHASGPARAVASTQHAEAARADVAQASVNAAAEVVSAPALEEHAPPHAQATRIEPATSAGDLEANEAARNAAEPTPQPQITVEPATELAAAESVASEASQPGADVEVHAASDLVEAAKAATPSELAPDAPIVEPENTSTSTEPPIVLAQADGPAPEAGEPAPVPNAELPLGVPTAMHDERESDERSVLAPVDLDQEARSLAESASGDGAEARIERTPATGVDPAAAPTTPHNETNETEDAPPIAASAGQDEMDMSSHHVDLPTWMEDSPSTSKSTSLAGSPSGSPAGAARGLAPNEPAAPLPSDPEASDNAEPTVVYLMSPEEIAAEERANSSKPPPSFEPLKTLQRLEQDRRKVLTDLEACTRAWSEIEKRAAQSTAELAKQIDALAKEHSQCDRVRKEIESRAQQAAKAHESEVVRLKTRVNALEPAVAEAKELRQRADALTQELQTARKEIEAGTRAKDELTTRVQKQENDLNAARTRAQSAEEQTKAAQARITEIERAQEQSNLQFARELDAVTSERDRIVGELQQRDTTIQTLTARCTDQEQRTTTLANEISQKDAQLADLGQELARLQQELEQQKRAYDAQRAVVEAAQGVMAELRPKMQMLESQLTRKG